MSNSFKTPPERRLYPVTEARQLLGGMSHGLFYDQVNKNRIRLTKIGRRSFVSAEEIARIAKGENA